MLGVLAARTRAEIELHLPGAHLASDDVISMLQRLSCAEAVLRMHGVSDHAAELLSTPAVSHLFRAWAIEQRDNFNLVLSGSLAQASSP
jgi:hypothetical protein